MEFIGFPPPLLGSEPVRLRLLGRSNDWIVLEKPWGCVSHAHPLYRDLPSLDRGLQLQQDRDKPEILRLCGESASRIKSAFFLGPEYPGYGLFCWKPETLAMLRNAFGSQAAEFTFHLLGEDLAPEAGDERECSLPIQEKRSGDPPFRVSHRYGKQAQTHFHRLYKTGVSNLWLWRGIASWIRPGQLFLHAKEAGIGIPGDPYFSEIAPLFKESFFRQPRPGVTPLLPGPPLYFSKLDWKNDPEKELPRWEAPEPREWQILRSKLEF